MSIIRPPISGDSPQDSWANQVTEAINKGLLAPSINAASTPANISLNGISAATLYLYTRTDGATPTSIAQELTYNYKSATFTGVNFPIGTSNWERSASTTANGDYLWITLVNISANVESEIIPATSWSTPTILAVNGNSSFVCEAFVRLATTPGQPSGGSYDFSTTTLTPPTRNVDDPDTVVWSAGIPAGSDPVYICTAIATVVGSTGTDDSLVWSQPVKMVENGAVGATGLTGATTNIIFRRQDGVPNSGNALSPSTGIPDGWEDISSDTTGNDTLWAVSGVKAASANPATTNFTWSEPFQLEGTSTVEVVLYRVNSNSTTGLSNVTYNFSTGSIDNIPSDWSTSFPSLSNGEVLYRVSGVVSGSPEKTNESVNFGTPIIFARRIDGDTGGTTNIIFRREATAPNSGNALTPSPGIPSGWEDISSDTTGTETLWAVNGFKPASSNPSTTNFTWSKPFEIQGEAVAEIALYSLVASGSSVSTTGLSNITYNFATKEVNSASIPSGWSVSVPSLSLDGDKIYRVSGVASGTPLELSASVNFGSPITPVVFAQRTDGTDGAPAVNTAVVYAYKWGSAVATDAPITTRTYTFATSAWSNIDGGNSWTLGEIPTKGSNTILSVCVAIASSTSATDNVVAADWSAAQIFTQDGANGVNTAVVNAYKRSASVLAATDKPNTTRTWTFNSGTWDNNDLGNGWSGINPSGTDDLYFCIAVASANTATDSVVAADWTAPQLLVSNGTNGAAGADGAELESGLVYYSTASASSPGTPSATDYNFNTGIFTNLTSGWQTQPVVVNITSTTALFWSARYRITKGPTDSTATVSFNAPIASVNFGTNIQSDNYVTGSSGWQIQRASGNAEFNNVDIRGGLIASSIVSAAITSKSITADQIDVDTLVIGSKNILTLDGSAIATRTHRTTVDDYTDGLNNLIVGSGSADGSVVTSGSATTDLRYRFSVQVDSASNSGTNNLRTKRFYYPVFTANTGYSIDGGNIEVFVVDDITSAQTTTFYVGVDGVDFYSAGSNNNSRQEVLGIGTSMYLNQAEILRLIDPAVEFNAAQAGQRFEVKFTADGTNIPSFTAFSLQAYAVNIEEFFEQSIPGLYNYTNTYEQITNVQLTGTTSTTAYATSVGTTSLTTNGSGTIYGIVRGF